MEHLGTIGDGKKRLAWCLDVLGTLEWLCLGYEELMVLELDSIKWICLGSVNRDLERNPYKPYPVEMGWDNLCLYNFDILMEWDNLCLYNFIYQHLEEYRWVCFHCRPQQYLDFLVL